MGRKGVDRVVEFGAQREVSERGGEVVYFAVEVISQGELCESRGKVTQRQVEVGVRAEEESEAFE